MITASTGRHKRQEIFTGRQETDQCLLWTNHESTIFLESHACDKIFLFFRSMVTLGHTFKPRLDHEDANRLSILLFRDHGWQSPQEDGIAYVLRQFLANGPISSFL